MVIFPDREIQGICQKKKDFTQLIYLQFMGNFEVLQVFGWTSVVVGSKYYDFLKQILELGDNPTME